VPTSNLTSRRSERRGTFTTWGFGHPGAAPFIAQGADYPPIAPSPSTGQTTLVTPTSGSTGKVTTKGWFSRNTEGIKANIINNNKQSARDPHARSPIVLRPESEEMVVVTYEEGLMKLGLGRPHQILSPEGNEPGRNGNGEADRGSADSLQVRQAYPVAGSRIKPGRGAHGAQNPVRSPHHSTWLPTYYHTPEGLARGELDEGSELGYRAVGGLGTGTGTGPGSDRWGRSRI